MEEFAKIEDQKEIKKGSFFNKVSIIIGIVVILYFLMLLIFSIFTEASVISGFVILFIGIILGIIGIIQKKRLGFKKSFFKTGLFLNIIILIVLIISIYIVKVIVTPYLEDEAMFLIDEKPIIYLYPQNEQKTTVQLFYKGELNVTYPPYNENIKGWNVTAYPDGRLINHVDGKEYSYLFWEGKTDKAKYDLSRGFVVEGKDTAVFLQETLSKMGLTPKEYNEFIVYWLPQMKDNKYNLIYFAEKEYTDIAPLKITPEPDSILRVFMVFKPLEKKINVEPQEIRLFERKGFAAIEWGGTEIE